MMNQSYRLSYEEDGVYFEAADSCVLENKEEILAYAKRKNLQQLSMEQALCVIDAFPCRVCIAPPQEEVFCDEQAMISISGDQMEAMVCLTPPDAGGKSLTYQELMEEIASNGVNYGIDESVLKHALENKKYGESTCFAKGILPEDGSDGELVFHFNTECSGRPAINEKDGRVDYKNLNLFEQVSEGQQLISRIPATEGRPGYTVTGRMLNPKKGKEAKLPAGKNVTYDEERQTMFASISGRVDYKHRTVTVSSCYNIPGDADLSVGNITFDGDVVVKGNVISDITINATRNIEVNGVVEGATLTAGGNIVLKNGIQGNDKGVLDAQGNVIAKYIERTTVRAGGDIIVDALIHCQAESGDSITAKGKYGSIIGGNIRAQNTITAHNIGSVVNNKTNIEVGMPLAKRARLKHLETELVRLHSENEKYDKIINYLKNMENLSQEKEQMKKKVIVGKVQNAKLISEYAGEIKTLEEEIEKAEMGKIHVTDTIFPGVKLTISLGEYTVTTPVKFSTFYCENRSVSFVSCQV